MKLLSLKINIGYKYFIA